MKTTVDEANDYTDSCLYNDEKGREIEFKVKEKVLKEAVKLTNKAGNYAAKSNKHFESSSTVKAEISPTIHELKNENGKILGKF